MSRSTRLWTIAYKVVGAVIALLILGAVVLVSFNNAQLRAENQDMYADLQASQDNAERLYEQLLALPGVEPEGEDPADVAPTTVRGDPGERGSAGPAGADGEPGAPGLDGVPGAPGVPGKDGTPGRDGESIVGPQGPQGETGSTGPQGESGRDGQSAFPFSFTFTVPQPIGPPDVYFCEVTASAGAICVLSSGD